LENNVYGCKTCLKTKFTTFHETNEIEKEIKSFHYFSQFLIPLAIKGRMLCHELHVAIPSSHTYMEGFSSVGDNSTTIVNM
jgi:hypothetical protein